MWRMTYALWPNDHPDMTRSLRLRAAMVGCLVSPLLWPMSGLGSLSAQTDSVSRPARRRIQPLPALASAPETGLQFGATTLAVWEPPTALRTRPTTLLAYALRTAKSQTRIGIEGEHWTRGNARRFAGTVVWQEFPLPFYGIGDRTSASDEEIFTPRGIDASLNVQQRIRGRWYAASGVRVVDQSIVSDSTGDLRQSALVGIAGAHLTEWTAGVLRDTRDNVFAPRAGHWLQLNYTRSADGVWSDYSYGRVRVDARAYHALSKEHVVATHFVVQGVDGAAPFDQLALVGGSDILRGYARGRFRDRWLMASQGEYRSPIRRRVGAVAFAGLGMSAPALTALSGRVLLPTYGAGLRLQIDPRQRTALRVDYGRGRDGAAGLYIGFNQAF